MKIFFRVKKTSNKVHNFYREEKNYLEKIYNYFYLILVKYKIFSNSF